MSATKKTDLKSLMTNISKKLTSLGFNDIHTNISESHGKALVTLECSKEDASKLQEIIPQLESDLNTSGVEAKILLTNKQIHKHEDKRLPINGVRKVILVASGKGGVGKSTVAFNLAITLARQGKKVGLVDVDIYGPSLPSLSGISQKPVLENDLMLPHKKFGIKMMSVGYLVEGADALIWRGPMTTKMLYQLIRMTNWASDREELDYLIVDTPPGTGDVHLSLAENYKIDGAIVVSTPQELALADAHRALSMFKKLSIPILGIVENFSYLEQENGNKLYIFGNNDSNKKLARQFSTSVICGIPIMQDINDACSHGKPITFFDASHIATKLFEKIADSV